MRVCIIVLSVLSSIQVSYAKKSKKVNSSTHDARFEYVIEIPATSVKDQSKSGTCWSFATLSFIESELLRIGNRTYDLSEMYIVHHTYRAKADKYVRMQGKTNFAGGGQPNDVMNVIKENGIVPEEAYSGILADTPGHNHKELDLVLKNYVEAIVEKPGEKLTKCWKNGFTALLDSYLGEVPQEFTKDGKSYNPKSFAGNLAVNPDDYVLISSFTHHPFYKPFIIEIPDNWSWGEVYNVPLNEFQEIADYSLEEGYSFVWAADYSEKGFMHDKGMAVVPEMLYAHKNSDQEQKIRKTDTEILKKKFTDLDNPVKEITVTQELRQKAFDNYSTTDDHGMHIVGKAKDKNGRYYYTVKNSWGTGNLYRGYFFASEAYFQYKSISIMVHKDAIPKGIRNKLGL